MRPHEIVGVLIGRHRGHCRDAEHSECGRARLDAYLLYMLYALVAIIAVVTAARLLPVTGE